MGTLIIIALVFMFLCGAPLFSVILGFAIFGASVTTRTDLWQDFSSELIDVVRYGTQDYAQILSTIPLFIFAGVIMAEAKTAQRMVRAAQAGVGWMPGGLAIVTIFACAAFTTFTGASGVTIVALGGLVMPALIKENYPKGFSLGLVAGTGSCGLLFPPALPLFVYGTVYGFASEAIRKMDPNATSFEIDRWLFAGIVPGLVLIAVLCVYSVIVSIRYKVPKHKFDGRELGRASLIVLPEMLLPVLVIVGLAKGIAIPEIASLSVGYVLLLEVALYRDIKLHQLWKLIRESMALVGALFIIIYAAAALTNFFVNAEVPRHLVDWITSTFESKWTFLLSLNILLLIVGMMMDIFSAILVVVPLIALPAPAYGIDPYHLGVIFLLNLELGYITPPVGLNLFLTGLKFDKPILDVTRATLPFLYVRIVALALVTYVPALTVVPEAARTGDLDTLYRIVKRTNDTMNSVSEVKLPDGTVVKLEDCSAIEASADKMRCEGLFFDLTKCRKEKDKACEKRVIDQYVDAIKGDEDWDIDLDDDSGDDLGDDSGDDLGGDTADKPGGDTADKPGGDTADKPGGDTKTDESGGGTDDLDDLDESDLDDLDDGAKPE